MLNIRVRQRANGDTVQVVSGVIETQQELEIATEAIGDVFIDYTGVGLSIGRSIAWSALVEGVRS
jgi:hypothetical protein